MILAVAGATLSLTFVATSAWWLALLLVALLVWRLNAATPRRAAWLAWCFGCAWLCAGTWWLYISMHRYGALPAGLAALAVFVLAAALSGYLALAAALYAHWRRGHVAADAALFAALWLLAELARGAIFTGFPWVASGYAWVDAPLALLAPWTGVYGLGAVLAFSAAWLAGLTTKTPAQRLTLGAPVMLALSLPVQFGPWPFTQPSGTLSVTLLQSNVAQDEKFAAQRMPEALQWAAQTMSASRADLVLAPETIIPLLPEQLEQFVPGYWAALRARFVNSSQAALVGVPLGDFDRGYSNSVVGLSRSAAPDYRYDKVHLVPFGEFIPTGFRWFTELMNIPLGDFSRGVLDAPSFVVRGERVAPNICYEDLFGEELAVRFADDKTAPTMMANVSNIAWFGDTIAIAQHLNISRMRALEFQRPMLRATNTGATALIDHRGRVTAQLTPQTRGVLDGSVQGRTGLTPFAWWASRWGLWPLWGLAMLTVLLLVATRHAPKASIPRLHSDSAGPDRL